MPGSPERAMAWECPAKLPSPPAKPFLTLRALGAKPSALQGGWPSLGACPEQLSLVSVQGPRAGPPAQ
ncbi:hypothetical protein Celaphus_00013170 [Cervus elaphus hippelaphus]|uniref:Uncharacterized protein n=1 Tax=Cervus elaphus hippelaphus TaxID=46360 RepID=A0A212DH99_CEREH|nr:hypothetical protein Celaphus_00013170 [Cervus elaphus hippelaphus]